ncbi:MAG: ROK family transcriptional regulator [Micromonosporaceae bacterium]
MTRHRQPGTPTLLRALNDRAALELLLTRGPLTRTQIGELTGLSKVTASQLVERLEARGLVARVGVQGGGRGPNAQLYAAVPSSGYAVGVEVGPRTVIAAAADITGATGDRIEITADDDADDPVRTVHKAVVAATNAVDAPLDKVRQVVIGSPGVVDPATGDVAFAFDLPHWHRGLIAELRRDLPCPVRIENDANLAAIAEQQTGAAEGIDDFALFWVSRGLGLAVVLGGRLYRGATGGAGEIGYLPVAGSEVPHEVSRRTKPSFSRIATADAIAELAAGHGFSAATAGEAIQNAIASGADGVPFLDQVAVRLAYGVAAVCVVLDPALVVLAGDIGRAGGAELAGRVEREVAAIAPVQPKVLTTQVEADPVLHGALLTAVEAARQEILESTETNPVPATD